MSNSGYRDEVIYAVKILLIWRRRCEDAERRRAEGEVPNACRKALVKWLWLE